MPDTIRMSKLDEIFIDYLVHIYSKSLGKMEIEQITCMRMAFYAGAKAFCDELLADIYQDKSNLGVFIDEVDKFRQAVKDEKLQIMTSVAVLVHAQVINERNKQNKAERN